MSDIERIREAGIHSAIIVDDGYDEAPQVKELSEEDAWESFFDDASGDAAKIIREVYPTYDPSNREELKESQAFINALWQNRNAIQNSLGELFEAYEQKIQDNRPYLETVEATLEKLEIPFKRCGRDFVEAAAKVDLIVIDLYLGIQQGEQDLQFTVERLKEVIKQRGEKELPSIVLMSQVIGIAESAKKFRQQVKLYASAFRHIRKGDMKIAGRLEGLILTLAFHRSDSQKLATFAEFWEESAVDAVRTAANTLRKIDIDDLQHIRDMLLRFEGINMSSYILDVFDRVLQYEIESHESVLKAANLLDGVANDPAPLMISNDRDTYAVIEKTLFVNPKRRSHVTGAEWPLTFGDILGPKTGVSIESHGFFSGRDDLVFFVASPECDLVRKDGLATALLVAGSLKEVDNAKPKLAVTANTTPILTVNGDKRFQVNWDFGDLRTISLDRAKRLLHPTFGGITIVARLRERSALSLRQQFLSSVGRVGELAPLPRSLRFKANLFLPLQENKKQPITVPAHVVIKGNVLIPRRGNYGTAIIDSNCEGDLTPELLHLNLDGVPKKSKDRLKILKEQSRIRQIFRSGFRFELPLDKPRNAGLLKLGVDLPLKDTDKPKTDLVALIVTGEVSDTELTAEEKNAGLILQVLWEAEA